MTSEMIRLTRKNFIEWLRELPPHTRMYRNSSCNCPIAQFLRQAGHRGANVLHNGWYATLGDMMVYRNRHVMPMWGYAFMLEWDDKYYSPCGQAQSALRIIEKQTWRTLKAYRDWYSLEP